MSFCTAINCLDGRTQLPVIKFLQQRFDAEYVDMITEAGPNLILADQKNQEAIESIHDRLTISIEKHNSVGIAIVGHHDCARNPASQDEQLEHLQKALRLLQESYKDLEIIALWVSDKWEVQEVAK